MMADVALSVEQFEGLPAAALAIAVSSLED